MADAVINEKLDALISAVNRLVNNPIAPVLPVAPVAPVLPVENINKQDHDILITFRAEVKTELQNIREDIKALGADTSSKFLDHETRLRINESGITKVMTWGTIIIIVIGLAEFLLIFYKTK